MSLYSSYINQPISQLHQTVIVSLAPEEVPHLDQLLDLVVLKTVAGVLNRALRPSALQVLRADPNHLAAWLDQQTPTARMAITEALTRILLSLTVE